MKFPTVMWTFAVVMPCSTCLSLPVPSSPLISEEEAPPQGTLSAPHSSSLASFTPSSSSSSSSAGRGFPSSLTEMTKGFQKKDDTDPAVGKVSSPAVWVSRLAPSQRPHLRTRRAPQQRPSSRKRRRFRRKCPKNNRKRRHRKQRKCRRSRKSGRRGKKKKKKRKQKRLPTKSGKRRRKRRRQLTGDNPLMSPSVKTKTEVANPEQVHHRSYRPTELVSVFDSASSLVREEAKQFTQKPPPHIGFHELQSGYNSRRPLKADGFKTQQRGTNFNHTSPVPLTRTPPKISRTNQNRVSRSVSVPVKRSSL